MTKVIYFRERTDTPLKVVKDKLGSSGCQKCYFRVSAWLTGGCPSVREERSAGSGYCETDRHHYEEYECES